MVIDRLASRIRLSGQNPATKQQQADWAQATRTLTGATVNDMAALSLTAFYRGVLLISQTVGGLPIQVFEEEIDRDGKEGTARKLKTEDTAYLWRRPNPEMTLQSFWERVVGDEVRGNAFIFVEKDDGPEPLALWYVDRSRVRVGRTSSGVKVYEIDNELPMIDYKAGGEIVHIPNWGGALTGYDPIKIAPQAIALGLSAEEYAARSFGQGQVPPGLLSTTMQLTIEQADALADLWERKHGGVRGAGKIAVLGNGATFQKVSTGLDEMQNVEARKFSVSDMARLLGLPPFLLADMDHASQGGGNGLEEQNRNLTTFNFQGHINRIQQAVSDDLLVRELTRRYMRMNTAGLLRGNTLQRYQAYRAADFMTTNQKLALEEMEPVEGGDELLVPLNMATAEDRRLSQLKARTDALGNLIRAGFEPEASLAAVGMESIEHSGRLPVTVQASRNAGGGGA